MDGRGAISAAGVDRAGEIDQIFAGRLARQRKARSICFLICSTQLIRRPLREPAWDPQATADRREPSRDRDDGRSSSTSGEAGFRRSNERIFFTPSVVINKNWKLVPNLIPR